MASRRMVLVIGMVACIAACSLLTSLDDLHSGADAAADGADGASMDGPLGDGPLSLDASADGPFCSTHPGHTFCFDFDEGPVTAGFSSQVILGAGADGGLDPVDFRSSPASDFAALVAGAEAGVCVQSQLIKDLPNTGNHDYHLEMDWETCGEPAQSVDTFSIIQNAGIDAFIVSADSYSNKLYTEGAGNHTMTYNMGPLAAGWHHVIVDASDIGGEGASRIHVTFDGATVLDVTTGWSWSVAPTELQLGLRACAAWPTCVMHFDNVLLDIH